MVLETKARISENMDNAARDTTIYSMRLTLGHGVVRKDSAALMISKVVA
jgi:hypothetical protein